MKGYRRNAIALREPHVPEWLVAAVREAQRQYDEAPWWKRAYWRASGLVKNVVNSGPWT
jgi:hypothetical protein